MLFILTVDDISVTYMLLSHTYNVQVECAGGL